MIDRLSQEFPEDYTEVMQDTYIRSCSLKFRDIIAETCAENSRRGEYVRIYPAKNSKIYDKFFSKSYINKIVYKTLFSSEVMPYPGFSGIDVPGSTPQANKMKTPPAEQRLVQTKSVKQIILTPKNPSVSSSGQMSSRV